MSKPNLSFIHTIKKSNEMRTNAVYINYVGQASLYTFRFHKLVSMAGEFMGVRVVSSPCRADEDKLFLLYIILCYIPLAYF